MGPLGLDVLLVLFVVEVFVDDFVDDEDAISATSSSVASCSFLANMTRSSWLLLWSPSSFFKRVAVVAAPVIAAAVG